MSGIALPAARPEEARRLSRRYAALSTTSRIDYYLLTAFPELALRDLRRGAILEPDHHRHGHGLALAKHPCAPAVSPVASARGRPLAPARSRARPIGLDALGQESERLLGEHEHVVVLGLDDARRRRHPRLERAVLIVDSHHDVVRDHVLDRRRRLAHLAHRALERPIREGLHRERGGGADHAAPAVGLATVRGDLELD